MPEPYGECGREGEVIKTRSAFAAVILAALAMGMSGCIPAINPNAGYNILPGTALKSSGTSTNYLYYPRGIAVDSTGNIYVVDSGNNRIVEMNPINIPNSSWISWTIPPIPSTPLQNVPAAEGIAVDSTGANIWIADSGNGRILHLTGWPSPSVTAYSFTTGSNTFSYPVGLALYNNFLYVTDPGKTFPQNTPTVYKFNVSAGFTLVASTTNFDIGATHASFPRGIAVNSTGVYITDETNYRIVEMDSGLTTVIATLGTRGSGTGQFISPQTIALDVSDNIYVVDSGNYWIDKIPNINSTTGWTRYGVQTGSPTTSVYPNWVAVDSSSNIYVSDDTNYQIAEFQ
jgi:tripartite motif-containing protein 71